MPDALLSGADFSASVAALVSVMALDQQNKTCYGCVL
jgi:hypothetical protein